MSILDQAQDTQGYRLFGLVKAFDPPEFVKNATHADVVGDPGDPDHLYADQTRRLLKCHTKVATLVSAMYFYDEPELYGQRAGGIETRIKAAAEWFGVSQELKKIVERAAPAATEKAASDYAFSSAGSNHYLPVRSGSEVKQAWEHLRQFTGDYLFRDRVKIAEAILAADSKYKVLSLAEQHSLQKAACQGTATLRHVNEQVDQRVHALAGRDPHRAEARNQLIKIAAQLKSKYTANPAVPQEVLSKMASMLAYLDEKFRLRNVDSAENIIQMTKASCQEYINNHVKAANGAIYAKADLARLPAETLEDVFGVEAVKEAVVAGVAIDREKLASLVGSLPVTEAGLFQKIAAVNNIKPVSVEWQGRVDLAALAG